MTKLPFAAVALALTLASTLHAQLPTMSDVDPNNAPAATGPLPDWDVALVKPHPADDPSMSWQMTDDGLSLINLPLEQMLCSAWDLKPYQLEGLAPWMKTTRFDLTAKVAGPDVAAYNKLNSTQRRQMLQALLTDRFQLKTHLETRTLPTYDLVIDKNGPRFKPNELPPHPPPKKPKSIPKSTAKAPA